METSPVPWLSEMGVENPMSSIHQCEAAGCFDEDQLEAALAELEASQQCFFSSETNSSSSTFDNLPRSSSATSLSSSMEAHQMPGLEQSPIMSTPMPDPVSPMILSFGEDVNFPEISQQPHKSFPGSFNHVQVQQPQIPIPQTQFVNHSSCEEANTKAGQGPKRNGTSTAMATKSPSRPQDHIIAERRRREQLSRGIIALSGIIPGLKKTDKNSVLGEAIKYLKQLQEREKMLEEQAAASQPTAESVVIVKKSQLLHGDDDGSFTSDEHFDYLSDMSLPRVEARVCNKNLLLRIHCEQHKGVLVKTLAEIEKLNLVVVNSNVVPFGSLAFHITIVAEVIN
ncbi:transcription factor bHLH18-like isoform X2 [Malania oleifera]|uniref:transcription factor bHLH18-like isoform X2 n=1 Tax=Malania oleifera TaxID=397392 RepID=UPI0025ADCDCA|nr:transcription factor bHLH18-like isoform X2 [Malania oleifera]